MGIANSTLSVSDLGFENIKESFKTFLRAQTKFNDYDFEGSNMSLLLDLLAYNTHYNTYYTNMVANEMYLDTALIRNNLVSRAKEIGYLPSWSKGAVANVSVTVVPTTSPNTVTISSDTTFSSSIDDLTLTFSNVNDVVITPNSSGGYIESNMQLVEGLPLTHKYTVSTSNAVDYLIPNENADLTNLTVTVQESAASSNVQSYSYANDITELSGTSKIYFLEEDNDKKYRVYFGDGVIGRELTDGNVVILKYRVCNTTKGNGVRTFSPPTSIDGHSAITVSTVSVGSGGQVEESLESIRQNAPLSYERQNRAVTVKDYERRIIADNQDFAAVSVWGGDDNDPQVFGKVYIAVKPKVGTVISDNRKAALISSLQKINVLSIDPEVQDVAYLYVIPTVEVNYNPDRTTKSGAAIEAQVRTAISDYQTNNLNDFGKVFRYSQFIKDIDAVDTTAIIGNETTVKMQKRFTPSTTTSTTYVVKFTNAIKDNGNAGDIVSTTFTYEGYSSYLRDAASNNIMQVVRTSGDSVTIVADAIGTIDYAAGTVTLNSFLPTAVDNSGVIKLSAEPVNKDITPVRDQILQIDDTTVTTTEDREV